MKTILLRILKWWFIVSLAYTYITLPLTNYLVERTLTAQEKEQIDKRIIDTAAYEWSQGKKDINTAAEVWSSTDK